jgi:hypothetical protein
VIHQQLMQPLAAMVSAGEINPGDTVRAELDPCKPNLLLRPTGADPGSARVPLDPLLS